MGKRRVGQAAGLSILAWMLWVSGECSGSTDRNVTLSLDRASLTRFADAIEQQAGQVHKADGPEASKQQVVILCNAQRPAAVRRAITQLLRWEWKVDASGSGYSLVKPYALRQEEEALRRRFWSQYAGVVRGMISAADRDPNELDSRSVLHQTLRQPFQAPALQFVGALPEGKLDTVLNGGVYSSIIGNLPGSTRGMFGRLMAAMEKEWGPREIRSRDVVRVEIPRNPAGQPQNVQLTILRGKELTLQLNCVFSHLALIEGQQPAGQPLGAGDASHPRELFRPLPVLAPLEWPRDPAALPSYMGWHLRHLARSCPFPLIADCYPEMERSTQPISLARPPYPAPEFGGKSARRVLDMLCEDTNYDWRVQDGWVILRYRQWFWEPVRGSQAAGRNRGSRGSPEAP